MKYIVDIIDDLFLIIKEIDNTSEPLTDAMLKASVFMSMLYFLQF
jgi:hypothetical protein